MQEKAGQNCVYLLNSPVYVYTCGCSYTCLLYFSSCHLLSPGRPYALSHLRLQPWFFDCGDKQYMTASFIISKVLCVSDKWLLVNVLIHQGLLYKSMYVYTRQSCQRFCNGQKKDYYVSYQWNVTWSLLYSFLQVI